MRRPVLRWFGGKFLLADWIISHFPKHKVYVEPYGGAASVLMKKNRSYAEVYNDIDGSVVSVFRILRDPEKSKELQRRLEFTPFAREEFHDAHDAHDALDDIDLARRMIVRSFQGFGADSVSNTGRATGFRSNSNRSGTTPAHDWANYPQNIPAFCERLRGVCIENKDALELMKNHDSEETLFFLDPPYMHETRGNRHGYNFEMTNEDHEKMLDAILQLKGMVILCGYPSSTYDRLGWHTAARKAYADGANERTECLWLSPNAIVQTNLFTREVTS
jgi:DNA adenine methylase